MLFTVFFAASFVEAAGVAQQTARQADRQYAEELTIKLAKLTSNYHRAGKAEQIKLQKELIGQARNRQELLAELVQTDPAGAMRAVLPETIRSAMPTEVQSMLEQKKDLQGELEVTYEDYADGKHELRHVLMTQSGRFELKLPDQVMHSNSIQNGTQVRARGWLFAHAGETKGSLVVNDASDGLELLADGVTTTTAAVTNSSASSTVLPNTMGEQNVLALMVNFQDNQAQPWTTAEAEQIVFGTVNEFYQENSNSQTWLAGDVHGYFTLPINETCDSWEIHVNAQEAAEAQGIDLSLYNRMVYIFPENSSCGWSGKGTLGGTVSLAWANGSLSLRTIGHELGHNFGLQHAEQLECGSEIIGDNCISITYGDNLDIMGDSNVTGHFNTFNKELLGWLASASGELITAESEGSFLLAPYESTQSGIAKGLRVPRGIDSVTGKQLWYYLEYRQALGFDSFLSDKPGITNGVVLRLATEAETASSQLLDMTPASSRYDLDDASLAVGSSYTDLDAGVTITTEWADATGTSVNISFAEQICIPTSPALTITPAESAWVEAGSTVAYTATVTNHDSIGCVASDFTVTADLPAGWSADSASLNLEPGASGTVTINVTSPPGTDNGFYDITLGATNNTNSAYQQTGTVTYVVDSPAPVCEAANPQLSVSIPDGEPVEAGTGVSYRVTITNQNSNDCDPAIFQVAAAVPANWSNTGGSVSLAPGKSGEVDVVVTSAADATDGAYPIAIRAANIADNNYYAEGTASYTVKGPVAVCEPANPLLILSINSSEEVEAGTTVQYSGTLTNQNSSDCVDSDFEVSATVPNSWSASSQSLTLAPGASAPIAVSVTSAPGAQEGVYSISIKAENTTDTSHAASTTASYVVAGPVNTAPRVVDDSVSLSSKNAIIINVLANDSDPDGDTLSVVQVTQGSKGSVQINADGSLLYTPAKNFKGSDSFSYTASDGYSSATAIVEVTLTDSGGGKGKTNK
ncbi:Ig-like domain-containing protein [Desulfosediminicola sp.]|uniref:Ig-like domain-containing protein n=1 Tax=Desulfosediminicola sp. TaxID=2886825 RepID=UPI003AF24DF9